MFRPVYLFILLFSLTGLSQGMVHAANLKPVTKDIAAPSLVLKDLQGAAHDNLET